MRTTIDIPAVPGDPSEMRKVAGAIEQQALKLETLRQRVSTATAAMEFKSKHGERTKSEVVEMSERSAAQSATLLGLAAQIRRRAASVATEQAERDRTIQRIRSEDEERMRKASRTS